MSSQFLRILNKLVYNNKKRLSFIPYDVIIPLSRTFLLIYIIINYKNSNIQTEIPAY